MAARMREGRCAAGAAECRFLHKRHRLDRQAIALLRAKAAHLLELFSVDISSATLEKISVSRDRQQQVANKDYLLSGNLLEVQIWRRKAALLNLKMTSVSEDVQTLHLQQQLLHEEFCHEAAVKDATAGQLQTVQAQLADEQQVLDTHQQLQAALQAKAHVLHSQLQQASGSRRDLESKAADLECALAVAQHSIRDRMQDAEQRMLLVEERARLAGQMAAAAHERANLAEQRLQKTAAAPQSDPSAVPKEYLQSLEQRMQQAGDRVTVECLTLQDAVRTEQIGGHDAVEHARFVKASMGGACDACIIFAEDESTKVKATRKDADVPELPAAAAEHVAEVAAAVPPSTGSALHPGLSCEGLAPPHALPSAVSQPQGASGTVMPQPVPIQNQLHQPANTKVKPGPGRQKRKAAAPPQLASIAVVPQSGSAKRHKLKSGTQEGSIDPPKQALGAVAGDAPGRPVRNRLSLRPWWEVPANSAQPVSPALPQQCQPLPSQQTEVPAMEAPTAPAQTNVLSDPVTWQQHGWPSTADAKSTADMPSQPETMPCKAVEPISSSADGQEQSQKKLQLVQPSAATGKTSPKLKLQVEKAAGGNKSRTGMAQSMRPATALQIKKRIQEPTRPRGVSKIDLSTVWGSAIPALQQGADKENPGVAKKQAAIGGASTSAHAKPRIPLVVLDAKVLQAASQRRFKVGITAKSAIRHSWEAAKNGLLGGNVQPARRKLLTGGGPFGSGHTDALPANMLFGDSFQIPKLLRR